ncbi:MULTISPECIES: hypothetical protein [unclassified Streptomyces]|uniref:hypothetical protein n=1 Tax=unclassified Streptomyces TaxID=2593676 RepID=UPI00224EEB85|nr:MULTISPECIES: hypothetical protein [unclassified Streptomyces]WSP55474.1 hypothetical protein OG306_14530 [Streptomyces sp. NBC_01241]WSU23797.1 hypothetical protein OG508_24580 [Streptomyces sp. NBC_01108]MCX4787160.1 hypothetical protein [Streptomyces sp. NBC_01221]MCX4797057.1 hypothetical protein [Streptomyces sp. NBC_01242]WSJ38363.1 hypothetical protein OG772_21690 [Streptomyces sp. NBC_01321]
MPGIDECLLEVMRLPGARGAAVVDWTSGLALGTIGESPNGDHEATAAETAEVARMAAEQPAFALEATGPSTGLPDAAVEGAPPPVEDVIVTTRAGYHILRFVETAFDSSVFVHLWLDRAEGNLALARIRLGEMAQRLVLA